MNDITLPSFIRFGRDICGDLAQAERREWWLANGLGGYAAGTVAGTLTRRYHGLLIAPVQPPLGRHLVFAKADATLHYGERAFPLFSNRWSGGVVDPHGYVHIESFELQGRMPVWRFAIGDLIVESRIWMEPGANTTYLAYRLASESARPREPLTLQLKLLVNARDHHVQSAAYAFAPAVEAETRRLRVIYPDWFTLYFRASAGSIEPDYNWYENFDMPAERERGLGDRDNHLCVGQVTLTLSGDDWVGLSASLHPDASVYLSEAMRRFLAHDISQLKRAHAQVRELIDAPDWVQQLVLAADSFIFARPLPAQADGESVIAGYPWFGDWGRDTMIALPGLTLATGRYDSARRILQTFARFVDRGMLPNVFPGAGKTPDYNTVDAALWYFEAWRAYIEAGGDSATLREAFPVLEDMIEWHTLGTRYGIALDPADGLIRAGKAGVQLTWMDAKVGDWVVTPRIGKPVEINALWYNALMIMADFAKRLRRSSQRYRDLAEQARSGFQRFLRPDRAGLYDVLDAPGGDDPTPRPNQIFAVSLPHSPLKPSDQEIVVEVCGREFLTSYGLLSLSPRHPDFRPYYGGGVWERDGAYHQGPAWGWLLGRYALAEYRVHGDAARAQARLAPIRNHLMDAALGTVSEIFDGAPPHVPRGAPAQAWSVSCTLEAWQRLERAKRQITQMRTAAAGD